MPNQVKFVMIFWKNNGKNNQFSDLMIIERENDFL